MPPPPGPPPARIPWLARALLVFGAPVLFLVLLEGTLRLAGYGRPTALFIPDTVPGYDRTNPAFTAPFFPPQFDITPLNFRIARKKPAGHLRVFVLGESAVRGTPEPGFGFAAQLGPQLRAAYPGRVVEVYNLGIVAINSHVVYQAARAAAALEPDLFVLYLGNNEVVGPYGPGSVNLSVMPPLAVVRASIWVAETRAGQLVQALVNGPQTGGLLGVERAFEPGNLVERPAQRQQIPRAGGAQRHLGQQALEIENAFELLAQLRP